jgi:2-polyprenyl-3-methyl-5-hydroxy-6-metoxy-1,4-benzoquinol methylase
LVVDPAVWRPRANEAFEDEWFGDDYDPEQSSWVRLFQRWYDRRTLKRLASASVSGNRLFEIGVGSGSFLRCARAAGFEVIGCDLSKPICARIERRFGIRTHCGYATELPQQPLFDVVVMNHVLEHVPDPVGLLRDVRERLAPNGVFHVAVPNVACFEARFRGWASYGLYLGRYARYRRPLGRGTRRFVLRGFQVSENATDAISAAPAVTNWGVFAFNFTGGSNGNKAGLSSSSYKAIGSVGGSLLGCKLSSLHFVISIGTTHASI